MKRALAVTAGIGISLMAWPAPAADAFGVGACVVSGTIRFTPSVANPDRGTWDIIPAVIQCQGMFNVNSSPRGRRGVGERFVGPGESFTGSGWYRTSRAPGGGCVQHLGEGNLDYWMVTENQDLHIQEQATFLSGGAGALTTPTLHGSFQVLSHDGKCMTGEPGTGLFTAELAFVRTSGLWA
jgi:hypothetical protein